MLYIYGHPPPAALLIYRFSILSWTLMRHSAQSNTANSSIAEILHRPIRELAFPENSNMGVSNMHRKR